MKVTGPGAPRATPSARKSERSAGAGKAAFASALANASDDEGNTTAGGAVGPAGLTAVGSLLAAQSTEDALSSPRKRMVERGEELLDRLDGLRDAILTGRLPPARLRDILETLERQRERSDDPALETAIDGIELRARVELAKWDPKT